MNKMVLAAGFIFVMLTASQAQDPNNRRNGTKSMEAGSSAGVPHANQSNRNYNQKGGGTGYNSPNTGGGTTRITR